MKLSNEEKEIDTLALNISYSAFSKTNIKNKQELLSRLKNTYLDIDIDIEDRLFSKRLCENIIKRYKKENKQLLKNYTCLMN